MDGFPGAAVVAEVRGGLDGVGEVVHDPRRGVGVVAVLGGAHAVAVAVVVGGGGVAVVVDAVEGDLGRVGAHGGVGVVAVGAEAGAVAVEVVVEGGRVAVVVHVVVGDLGGADVDRGAGFVAVVRAAEAVTVEVVVGGGWVAVVVLPVLEHLGEARGDGGVAVVAVLGGGEPVAVGVHGGVLRGSASGEGEEQGQREAGQRAVRDRHEGIRSGRRRRGKEAKKGAKGPARVRRPSDRPTSAVEAPPGREWRGRALVLAREGTTRRGAATGRRRSGDGAAVESGYRSPALRNPAVASGGRASYFRVAHPARSPHE